MRRAADLFSPWTLGAVAVAGLTTACVSTAPIYQSGPPRFVSAAASECVPYARMRSGIQLTGDADRWWQLASGAGYRTGHNPLAGSVLVLRVGASGARGHVAYVTRVNSSREIIVDHANWHGRREVAVDVPVIDVSPNNDWSQVKVYWVETGKMGARTYGVDGFILPQRLGPGV